MLKKNQSVSVHVPRLSEISLYMNLFRSQGDPLVQWIQIPDPTTSWGKWRLICAALSFDGTLVHSFTDSSIYIPSYVNKSCVFAFSLLWCSSFLESRGMHHMFLISVFLWWVGCCLFVTLGFPVVFLPLFGLFSFESWFICVFFSGFLICFFLSLDLCCFFSDFLVWFFLIFD